ncbi:MAG: hypothetical protein IT368_15545 [Candidatus Hydrogenedentes bacterium]|nr:hypothetical protein [Candidatus Hydrogenedentota bacterium]
MTIDKWLQHILALHFDSDQGTPFWLDQRAALGFDPLSDIRRIGDLVRFPPFPREALAGRPVEDFVPRRFHAQLAEFITSETGGTTGPPARTVFRKEEFHAAFVAPFVAAAKRTGFPRGENWLFIGPSGPHPIGKAARLCAEALGSMDPFMVDFDPRWARKLDPASLARKRYVDHVLAQAESVLMTQQMGVIFATPPVLAALGEHLPAPKREAVRGVHLGGMAADQDFWRRLTMEWFPNAVCLSGYGNSLCGMCPQIALNPEAPPEYFPHGNRLILETGEANASGRGEVRFHRLDESGFLPNVIERDEAEVVSPPADAAAEGFTLPGLRDPRPPDAQPGLGEGLD